MNTFRLVIACALVLFVTSSARAKDITDFDLPTSSKKWINGGPYSTTALKNKTVVFYFFEEDCGVCFDKMSSIAKMGASSENEPVLIIAVNSGNTRKEVKKFVEREGVGLPLIVDRARRLERQFNFGAKISPDNAIKIRMFRPKKRMTALPFRGTEAAFKKRLGVPSWYISPSNVPNRLKPLWRAVEFGNYQLAGQLFQKIGNVNGQEKKTVQSLRQLVHAAAQEQLNQARKLRSSGKPWEAFKLYRDVTVNFRNFPDFTPPRSALQSLKENKTVKKELKASRIFQRLLERSKEKEEGIFDADIKSALDNLIQNAPDTEAAKQAKFLRK